MIVFDKDTKNKLLELYRTRKIYLEGNLPKLIDAQDDTEFAEYLKTCINSDKENRRKRLEITKQIQTQNKDLIEAQAENDRIQEELRQTLIQVDTARHKALNDLDVLQKRTQFQLINLIVKISLIIIIGVGVTTTALYMVAMFAGKDTQIIGSTWSNMFGILLTNAFSIIGTIMGVKYASEKPSK
jgi:hypothetical protein